MPCHGLCEVVKKVSCVGVVSGAGVHSVRSLTIVQVHQQGKNVVNSRKCKQKEKKGGEKTKKEEKDKKMKKNEKMNRKI